MVYFFPINSCIAYSNEPHSVGPAEQHLRTYTVTPVVVGHFNEASEGLLSLIRAMAKATSKCRHRQLGYKSALGGVRPAQARLMRRLGIAAARANAHHLIVARHSIGRVSSVAAQERARTGAAREGAETSDEDFHRTGSRFEPEGERARQAAGEDYGRPAESEYAAEHESARTA